MTSSTVDEKIIREITTFDEKEFLLNKSKVDFSLDDDAYDKRWHNTYEYRNSDKEFVLTDKGYELKNNSKAWYYIKDTGKGFLRGGVKLTEGVGSLALATLEKMNIVSEGSVENFANFYQENIYEKIGDTETMAGGFAEGIGQFIVPGIGAYGMFAKIFRAKGVWPFLKRALSAEAVTVGVAQVPGDPNFAAFISQMLGVDNTKADNIAKEFWNYIVTPDVEYGESYNADDVFSSKLKAIIGDAPLGPVGEGLVPLFKMFAKGVRKLRGNKEVIEEIDKNIVKASDKEVFDIDNPPKGVIETKMPQKGDLDYEEPVGFGLSKDRDAMDDLNKDIAEQVKMMNEEDVNLISSKNEVEKMALVKSNFVQHIKNNPEGFTISIDGTLTPNKGFAVAPLKNTEYRIDAETINMDDIDIFAQNIFALRQATDENINVYGGGWIDKENNQYVLDAVHIIDNEADALYIAQAGNQDAIFNLGTLDEIKTDIGINKLKEGGTYESNKADVFGTNKEKLTVGFEEARDTSSSITKTEDLNYQGTFKKKSLKKAPTPENSSPGHEIYSLLNDTELKELKEGSYGLSNLYTYHTGIAAPPSEKVIKFLKSIDGNPEKKVIIYRAIPKDAKNKIINPGDFVTWDKDYAIKFAKDYVGKPFYTMDEVKKAGGFDKVLGTKKDKGYVIIAKEVKAKELYNYGPVTNDDMEKLGHITFNAKRFLEWGYWPEKSKSKNIKKRYMVKEELDLDTEDMYGISAEEIDEFNARGDK